MNNMTKLEMLWIRACKSETPKVRCSSVLRRFYMGSVFNEKETTTAVIIHLSDIVDKYHPMKTIDALNYFCECNPFFDDQRSNHEKARDMLISRVRHAKKSVFVGMKTPSRFKD